MKASRYFFVLLLFIVAGTAFIQVNQPPTPLTFMVPQGWPQPVYDFKSNPLTQEGFELGKKLFYDGQLSRDGNFACASCHQQFGAFNNYDHNLSHGIDNQLTTRNAPSLQNLAWQSNFMWDGSIAHLDQQFIFPLTAKNEMGETVDSVIKKLSADTTYTRMFAQAFGNGNITGQKIGKALSQFMVMLVSSNSKYDKVKRGQASFNQSEALGYDIFKNKCSSCHTEPMFTDNSFRNTGMQLDYSLNDLGRMNVTKDTADFMKFRVPSLRNVQVTFPYGHDGRFYRLYDVMEHYRNNLVAVPNTDPLVKDKIPLTPYEIGRLTAFLNTLTDSSFLTNRMFVPDSFIISPSLMHTH